MNKYAVDYSLPKVKRDPVLSILEMSEISGKNQNYIGECIKKQDILVPFFTTKKGRSPTRLFNKQQAMDFMKLKGWIK